MTWEQCRNYGVIEIDPNGSIKLYCDRFSYILLSPNGYSTVTSACWQGNSVIVRGYNQYKEPECFVYRSVWDFYRI